jgi:hypothetical protein
MNCAEFLIAASAYFHGQPSITPNYPTLETSVLNYAVMSASLLTILGKWCGAGYSGSALILLN